MILKLMLWLPWPELTKKVVLSGKVLTLKLSYLLNLPYSVNSDIGEKYILCSWHMSWNMFVRWRFDFTYLKLDFYSIKWWNKLLLKCGRDATVVV